jgi:hypothetical protein
VKYWRGDIILQSIEISYTLIAMRKHDTEFKALSYSHSLQVCYRHHLVSDSETINEETI